MCESVAASSAMGWPNSAVGSAAETEASKVGHGGSHSGELKSFSRVAVGRSSVRCRQAMWPPDSVTYEGGGEGREG